ncbi:MAG: hypothetical protein DCF24_01330 [Cyanobium sp.]|nr:MAG: hypothetical protein DCF24_01330 [Cyanobium sp.]
MCAGLAPALTANVIAQDRPQEGGAGLAAAVRVKPMDQLRGQTHGKGTHDSAAQGVEPYPVWPVLASLRKFLV